MEFDEEIREFLIESNENLANLDREIIQLEQTPGDIQLVSSVFRTIHTIKGTCGFFGYDTLGSVAHVTENLLSQVREGQRELTPELISLVLEAVDAVKALLSVIEATGAEGDDTTGSLRARLEAAHKGAAGLPEPAPTVSEIALPAPLPVASMWNENTSDPVSPAKVVSSIERGSAAEPVPAQELPNTAGETLQSELLLQSASEPARDAAREAQLADSTIRVDVALLNRLMNLVGELVLARNQLLQDTSAKNPSLQQTSQRLNLITSELQEGVMKTRMQPIGVVWNKLPRVVRDLAAQCGKRIRIEMEGANTELDKTIIEAIKDPLTHIVRNACDHGIEVPEVRVARQKRPEGLLLLRAYHEGGVVNIEILDDGAGIDPERVKHKAIEKGLLRAEQAALLSERDIIHMIFLPGFSTAAAITSVSGRGVGMDVVKTNIEKIGGSVEVQNRGAGTGTTTRIKIPLTLAIIPGLVVTLRRSGSRLPLTNAGTEKTEPGRDRNALGSMTYECEEERFIIPQANLLELVHLEGVDQLKRIENVHGTPVFHHRNKLLPLVYLDRVLGWRDTSSKAAGMESDANIIVVQAENRQMGLVVDRICDTQEIVVKPLGRQLKGLVSYVGATIMGDGRPALILDVAGLGRLAGLSGQTRQTLTPEAAAAGSPPVQAEMMLLFRAGRYQRLAVPLALVDRLEEIDTAKLERAGGRPVLYYRGDILPLIDLAAVLDPSAGVDSLLLGEEAQVIVFAHGTGRLGLVVEQILDIIHEPLVAQRACSGVRGLLGSAVIGGRITDLIDIHALMAATDDTRQSLSSAPLLPSLAPLSAPSYHQAVIQ